jgi:virginiamycin A acetyltransferase
MMPPQGSQRRDMRETVFGRFLFSLSRVQRFTPFCLSHSLRREGGSFFSLSARRIMQVRFGVEIGAYSYGSCFEPCAFGPNTSVGRYVSIGPRVRAYQANHPTDRLSTHAFFFNGDLGYIKETNVSFSTLRIEHDVWIGDGAIITPSCRRIGIGAVIGAGSIVTKDVPDFGIAAGNPARIIKWRFPEQIQEEVRRSRWWEKPISECLQHLDVFEERLGHGTFGHPFLRETSVGQTAENSTSRVVAPMTLR